jgi:hypothetical protein
MLVHCLSIVLPFCYPAFDFVVGGPPCTDYCGANAQRQGSDGEQGSCLIHFGNLVQRIQAAQPGHVYFLAENTIIRNSIRKPKQLDEVEDAFPVSWNIVLDAQNYSPVRRNRMHFTNIPLEEKESDFMYLPYDSSCLIDDFHHAAYLLEPDGIFQIRFNTLMASSTAIESSRMQVFKAVDGHASTFFSRPITIQEREDLAGLKQGYVEEPGMCCQYCFPTDLAALANTLLTVKSLFQTLIQDGYGNLFDTEKYWKLHLRKDYHKFGGMPHQFERRGDKPSLKLSPPQTGKTVSDQCLRPHWHH